MRRSGLREPAASRRLRAPQANSIAPSMITLRKRPSACANGWRRESGYSSTMRKKPPEMLSRSQATEQSRSKRAGEGKHVSRSSFRKQMVDRVRRDVVDAGGARAGNSLHVGPLHQTAESGIWLGSR